MGLLDLFKKEEYVPDTTIQYQVSLDDAYIFDKFNSLIAYVSGDFSSKPYWDPYWIQNFENRSLALLEECFGSDSGIYKRFYNTYGRTIEGLNSYRVLLEEGKLRYLCKIKGIEL